MQPAARTAMRTSPAAGRGELDLANDEILGRAQTLDHNGTHRFDLHSCVGARRPGRSHRPEAVPAIVFDEEVRGAGTATEDPLRSKARSVGR